MDKKKSSQQIWNEKNKDKFKRITITVDTPTGNDFKRACEILGVNMSDVLKDKVLETIEIANKNK